MLFRRVLNYARPWVQNSVQIAAIYAAGDFTQQKLFSKVKGHDYESTKNVMIVGGGVLSPLYIVWYNFLDRKVPGTCGKSLIKKIVVDQLIAGTIGTCIFFIAMSVLEKKDNILTECKEKAPTAYLFNMMYWPFVMLGIFKKVPVAYQPVAVACGDFVWSIFLCYYKMKDLHPEDTVSHVGSKSIEHPIDNVKVNASEKNL